MPRPHFEPVTKEEFDTTNSVTSIDSENLHLHPEKVKKILSSLRSSPYHDSHHFCYNGQKNGQGQSKCPCSVCIYTAQETFDTSYSGKLAGEDLKLRNAYEKLLVEHRRALNEVSELRSINRGLIEDKMQLSRSLKNSQQQLHVLLRSMESYQARENINYSEDTNTEIIKMESEAKQRLDFCYNKLEQYIIKIDDQETIIEDLQLKLQHAIKSYQAENNALKLRLCSKSNFLDRLNKTDGNLMKRVEPFVIQKAQNSRENDDFHRRTSSYGSGKLFGDTSSFDNLFIDYDVSEGEAIFSLPQAKGRNKSKGSRNYNR